MLESFISKDLSALFISVFGNILSNCKIFQKANLLFNKYLTNNAKEMLLVENMYKLCSC